MTDFKSFKSTFLSIGAKTSRETLVLREQGLKEKKKPNGTVVTNADLACETLILESLHTAYPDIPVLSEECHAKGIIPELNERFFCVDPIDGTHAYAKGGTHFTVNIALIEEGKPVIGMIAVPTDHKIYYGDPYHGASLHDCLKEEIEEIRCLHMRKPVPGQLKAVVSLAHKPEDLLHYLRQKGVYSVHSVGSSLKFCLLAGGEADIYARFDSIMEWDIAAGDALLRAAGGQSTQMDGTPLFYGRNAPDFHTPAFIARSMPSG